jgi:hypothetical protein
MLQHKIAFVITAAFFMCPVIGRGGPHHGEDIVVGRSGAGQLATEVPEPGPHELPPVNMFIHGWALADPGLLNLAADEPAEDFFALASGAAVNLELLSSDPALKVWSEGFGSVLTAPGNSFVIGGSQFDYHPTFHVDSHDPNFDPGVQLYSATFRLFDTGATAYMPSEPFTLTFMPVPEPTTALLFGVGVLGVLGKRVRGRGMRGDS